MSNAIASPIRNVLISVSDKRHLAEFAQGLVAAGAKIFSTGGTARVLSEAGLQVQEISQYTGFPEMMDGRLKTLHPKVFGGILCRHDRADDMAAISEHGIEVFDLIVVNLYPFEETIAKDGVTDAEAIEQIDIGGPSLVRAAAKNHAFTAIATNPDQYKVLLEEIQEHGGTTLATRRSLAGAAFAATAKYDCAIAEYFAQQATDAAESTLPLNLNISLTRKAHLRYGENPHQPAAAYGLSQGPHGPSLITAEQLNGKELSYNNLLDLDSALSIARSLYGPGCVVIKHNNPCGAAVADELNQAALRAMDGDPESAFGSVLGINRTVDAATAEVLTAPGRFIEAIAAPDFEPAALEIFTTVPKWKDNVRLMKVGPLGDQWEPWQYRWIEGGMLVQSPNVAADPEADWKCVTKTVPSDEQLAELRFAWTMVRHVKSNAIVLAKDQALCGVGAGQMSRVDSVKISINKAGDRVKGSALASDAFFPFPDSIHFAAEAGVAAIIQPGGSRKDDEVIAACNQHGLPMIFTGRRHFKH